jgi:hypothetical protein
VAGVPAAARRLLVLAGAVAGLWLVSWLTSGDADAATPGLPDPIGVVAGALNSAHDVVRPAAAPIVAGVAGPVSRAGRAAAPVAGGVVEPVSRTTRFTAPVADSISRAAQAAVSPVTASAATVVQPVSRVVRSAVPVLEPVSGAAKAVLSPVTASAATVVQPLAPVTGTVVKPVAQLLRSADPLVSAVTQPLADVLEPVTATLVEPVLDAASPVLTDLLTPVAGVVAPVVGGAGRPIVAPGGDVGVPPHRVAAGVPPLSRKFVPVAAAEQAKAAVAARAARLTASGPECAGTTTVAAGHGGHRGHRGGVAVAHHARSRLGGHGPAKAPAHPGAPVSSDVASGAGSTIPPAFLTPGHTPHGFQASPRAHGDFVPLWRPCEPGTGPG